MLSDSWQSSSVKKRDDDTELDDVTRQHGSHSARRCSSEQRRDYLRDACEATRTARERQRLKAMSRFVFDSKHRLMYCEVSA